MAEIKVITKDGNEYLFESCIKMGLYEKFANDEHTAIYITQEQYAICYLVQEVDKIKKELGILE